MTRNTVQGRRGGGRWRWHGSILAAPLILALTAPHAIAGLPVQPDPVVEARVDSLVRVAVDFAFAGRLDLGLSTVDLAEEIAPRDPRIGLTRYRLLRENYPTGMYEKSRARQQAPALMAELDQTIAVCDSMLELDEDNAAAYLYRGWAYMSKAQTHLIARRMRATAADCRRANSDLDKFYEYQPEGDPDAATVLGAYLFYADALPGFFKFIRWLIRVPGGDRERGLELLRQGAAGDGYTSRDAELVLAVTYYLFDGNLEDAVTMLGSAIQRYPHHPWVVEYTCSMSYLYPEKTKTSIAAESVVLDGWDDTTRGWEDAVNYRLRWTRARLNRQLGRYDMALAQMTEIIGESPHWPSWMVPRTHMEAIELAVSAGRADEAIRLCREVPDDERYAPYRRSIGPACADVDELTAKARARDFAPVRETLYAGRVEEAAELLERATSMNGNSVEGRFLEGEIARYQGRIAEAIDAYEDVEKRAQEGGADALCVHALQRMGEIYLQLGYYQDAEQCYNRARDIEPPDTMLSNLIRGRLRYIERQKDGSGG